MYITNQRYFVFILFIFLLVFSMNDITDALPVCDRTPQVRDGIVAAAGVAGCADVTDAHLAAIITLNLKSKGIETLKDGDFDGLSALKFLNLSSNDLSSLPSGILDNLTTLKGLYLGSNDLSSLPSHYNVLIVEVLLVVSCKKTYFGVQLMNYQYLKASLLRYKLESFHPYNIF